MCLIFVKVVNSCSGEWCGLMGITEPPNGTSSIFANIYGHENVIKTFFSDTNGWPVVSHQAPPDSQRADCTIPNGFLHPRDLIRLQQTER